MARARKPVHAQKGPIDEAPPKEPQPKQLMRFKLVAGKHTGPDYSAPDPEPGKKRPSRTYRTGETVVDYADLERLHGSEKFKKLGGDGKRYEQPQLNARGAHFPGGQVSTGHQASTSLSDGTTISGPEEEIREGAGGSPILANADLTGDGYELMNSDELRAEAKEQGVDVEDSDTDEGIREKLRAKERDDE